MTAEVVLWLPFPTCIPTSTRPRCRLTTACFIARTACYVLTTGLPSITPHKPICFVKCLRILITQRTRQVPTSSKRECFIFIQPAVLYTCLSESKRGWESWHRSGNLRNVQSRIVHWTPRTLFKSLSHALSRRGALGELMDEGFRMCATSARSRRRKCSSALASSEHRTRMYIPRASCIRSIRYRQSGNLVALSSTPYSLSYLLFYIGVPATMAYNVPLARRRICSDQITRIHQSSS